MNQYIKIMNQSPLFWEITDEEIASMLTCLSAKVQSYKKNHFIFQSGDIISMVGMVVTGSVYITKEDFWGNRSILTKVTPGQLFGETYACVEAEPLAVGIVTAEASDVIFFDIRKIMTSCTSVCVFHTKLIRNLLSVMAEKNLLLTKKMEHMGQRSTKEKLLSYLSAESQKKGSSNFSIPFNRQQLADYLCVDRSAMSNELCKLRDEGILTFEKNQFELKD